MDLSGLSVVSKTSLAVAVIVFAALAIVALLVPEKRPLDRRVHDLTDDGAQKAKAMRIDMSGFRQGLGWLYGQLRIEGAQKFASDWLAMHSLDSDKQRKLLLQAGIRHPRAHVYFALTQAYCGVLLAIGAWFILLDAGMFGANPVFALAIMVLFLFLGLYLPSLYLKSLIQKRRLAFNAYWDDALGLLIICLDAGLSIEVAMRRIAHELAISAPVLAEELIITVAELSLLKERRLAYLNLSERMDLPSVKSVTIALIQTEKQGASIANSLRTITQTNRQARISRAEEKAAALGPKMTVPMIVFFLPVVFVIIIAPVVLSANL
jgi:tight adherence protein C